MLVATLAMMVLSAGMVLTRELLTGSVFVPPLRVAQPRVVQPVAEAEPVTVAPPRREMPPALGVPISAIEDVAHSFRDGGGAGRSVAVFGATNGVETSLAAITLARSLAKSARVVLVDLGPGQAEIRAISSDPTAPGLSDLVLGAASFGNIITKDKLSPLHLISAGQSVADEAAILSSRGLESTFAALARSYEHVVVDAGGVTAVAVDRVAQFAPRALLVADALTSPATMAARERLLMAGYADVTVLVGARVKETSRAA